MTAITTVFDATHKTQAICTLLFTLLNSTIREQRNLNSGFFFDANHKKSCRWSFFKNRRRLIFNLQNHSL